MSEVSFEPLGTVSKTKERNSVCPTCKNLDKNEFSKCFSLTDITFGLRRGDLRSTSLSCPACKAILDTFRHIAFSLYRKSDVQRHIDQEQDRSIRFSYWGFGLLGSYRFVNCDPVTFEIYQDLRPSEKDSGDSPWSLIGTSRSLCHEFTAEAAGLMIQEWIEQCES